MAELNEEMFNEKFNAKDVSINDYIKKGEKILWHGKPKAKSYVFSKVAALTPIALIWLIFDSFIIYTFIAAGSGTQVPIYLVIFLIVFFAIHLMPVWIWLSSFIRSYKTIKFTEYYVTNKRILVTNFPADINIQEMNIKDIQDVILTRNGIDRYVKVGDIKILGSNATIILYDIKQPEKIYTIFENVKARYANLDKLPTYKICEYCNNHLKDDENKCPNCGAVYLKDEVID